MYHYFITIKMNRLAGFELGPTLVTVKILCSVLNMKRNTRYCFKQKYKTIGRISDDICLFYLKKIGNKQFNLLKKRYQIFIHSLVIVTTNSYFFFYVNVLNINIR